MSQKKVDAYKERKANRQKYYKKEKRILMFEKLGALVICLIAVGWLGYSIYGQYQRSDSVETETTTVDMSAVDDYMAGLNSDDTGENE